MMSPQTLDRVSRSYRRGYYDGYASLVEVGAQIGEGEIKPFADFDYSEAILW